VKTENAIRHKLKQVRFRYLKQRIEAALKRRPENCLHNELLEGFAVSDTVRVCFAQTDFSTRKVVVCDARFGGCARSEACSLYESRQNKAEIKSEFYAELEKMTFPELAFNYPDMAALLWVLADEGLEVPTPDPHEFDLPEASDVKVSTPVTAPSDYGYREPDPPVKPPSWIDRILGRVPS
jgi:hypothetical protein